MNPAVSTIKSSREIQTIFEQGRRVAHPLVVALVLPSPHGRGPGGRVAFIAGRRLGGAVQRNRAKRVLREAVRRLGSAWPGYDVALIAREETGAATSCDVDKALGRVLERGGVIQ